MAELGQSRKRIIRIASDGSEDFSHCPKCGAVWLNAEPRSTATWGLSHHKIICLKCNAVFDIYRYRCAEHKLIFKEWKSATQHRDSNTPKCSFITRQMYWPHQGDWF